MFEKKTVINYFEVDHKYNNVRNYSIENYRFTEKNIVIMFHFQNEKNNQYAFPLYLPLSINHVMFDTIVSFVYNILTMYYESEN